MTVSDRQKKPEIVPTEQYLERPKIWVDGRQRPRFDVKAYLTVSLAISRRDLKPEVVEAADRLQAFGRSVAVGERRLNVARLGKFARIVPSHQRVGRSLQIWSRWVRAAGDLVLPQAVPEDPIAYPNLIRPSFSTRPAVPQEVPEARRPPIAVVKPVEEPTLHAIRSAIGPTVQAVSSAPPLPDDPLLDLADLTTAEPGPLGRGMAWTLAAVMLPFALPAGAIKALMFHFDGGDLNDWA
ncbi:MAG: hypothetical protein ABI832_03055 [bacterium]